MKALLQKLVETAAPSGYEAPVREIVRAEIASLADELSVDALGNLIARKGNQGLKILVAAHLDEIGVIASHIDEHGFIRFQPLGGVFVRHLPGSRVRFLSGAQGVIGTERMEGGKNPPLEAMYIDVGASSRAACPVKVGDVAVFERPFLDLGERLVSKAMDDRVSVAILIETLRRLAETGDALPHQVFFVFSVQEEVGTRGATTAAFGLDPDLGLAVDVTTTGDTPKGARMDVALGKGPAIKVRDTGMLADPRVVSWMQTAAEAAEIPYQLELLEGGSTDARAIQLSRSGVPAGCLSIPCRYVHSPSEMVDFGDVQHAVHLLTALLSQPVDLGTR